MESHYVCFTNIVPLLLLFTLSATSLVEAQNQPLVSALYVFGDSTTDPGNNNGLDTISKANFPPYGRDFPNGRSTGRFTNGRLITDILSEFVGLPNLLPANLDPEFRGEKLLTGASFGSSASGYTDSTAHAFNVLTLEKQVNNFRIYKAQLVNMVGQENANKTISEALFGLSTGTNDFTNNYYLNPITMSKNYSVEGFQNLLIQSLTVFIQNVYSEGCTKLAIIGLPPFGCLPSQITLHNLLGNTCVEEFNEVAISFNAKIKDLAGKMMLNNPDLRIVYLDIYDTLADILNFPFKYGFKETRKGCCGTGLLEAALFCNQESLTCGDASKYVFWDSFHPTSRAYNIVAGELFQQGLASNIIPIPKN